MPLGINCVGYRNSAALGSGYATPTFNELGGVQDLKINQSKNKYKCTTRAEKGMEVEETTTTQITVTGKMRIPELAATTGNPDYDDLAAFRTAWNANSVLDLMFLDGGSTTNGSQGIRGFFKISKWDEDQSNDVATFMDFELVPCPVDSTTLASTATAQAMRHVLVATGAPTYANWGSNSFS